MIDLKEQLDIAKKKANEIPEGKQKSFLMKSIDTLEKGNTINISEFVNKLSEIDGEKIDIEKLKKIEREILNVKNNSTFNIIDEMNNI